MSRTRQFSKVKHIKEISRNLFGTLPHGKVLQDKRKKQPKHKKKEMEQMYETMA